MTIAHDFVDQISNRNTLPGIYHRIRALIAAPDTTLNDYVITINSDPVLAARVMDIANSSFFNSSRNINTIEQAISHLGVMQLKDILLCNLTIRAFATIPDSIVNLSTFWQSSILCGIIARILAKKSMVPTSDQLFTLGLLHDIGHLVMYSIIPEQTLDIFAESKQCSKPVSVIERERLGTDYAQVGSELMHHWSFPESYQEVTAHHPEPKDAAYYYFETAIVHIARNIAFHGGDLGSGKEFQIKPIAWSITNLSEAIIADTRKKAQQYIDEIANCLHVQTHENTINVGQIK
jgi:HD-like signal output (HDOD) protein